MPAHGKSIVETFKRLKAKRSTWLDLWEELADYFFPSAGGFVSDDFPGRRIYEKIFDSTARNALTLATSGIFARSMNPAIDWFFLKHADKEMQKNKDVQLWLDEDTDILRDAISSQLASQMFQVLRSLLLFGTGIMLIEADDETGIRGKAFQLKDVCLVEDSFGNIREVYREFTLTPTQAAERWDNISDDLRQMAEGGDSAQNRDMKFIHSARPRKNANPDKDMDPLSMPWEITFVEQANGHVIEETGDFENPYITPRLDIKEGEIYGRGPADEALADVRSLNELRFLKIDAINMAIRPPLDIPEDAYVDPFMMFPGANNYNQDTSGRLKASAILGGVGDVGITHQEIQELKASIRQIFLNDQLQLLNGGTQMTAFEVQQRVQQNMFFMAPWLSHLEPEMLSKIVLRSFNIMLRAGRFPEAPEVLGGTFDIDIIYDSPLARAQRQNDVVAIDQTIEFGQANNNLNVLDNFDTDQMAKDRATLLGLGKKYELDEDSVEKKRAERDEAAAASAQMQQLLQGSQALSNVGKIPGAEGKAAEVANEAMEEVEA